MYHYTISLLDNNTGYIILDIRTKDAPYKSESDILTEVLDLKNFIIEKHPDCKKITLPTPIIRNESFICNNIIQKCLNRDSLHLN